jgi:hypothetical protein
MEKLTYLDPSLLSAVWSTQEQIQIQNLMSQKYRPFLYEEEFVIEGYANNDRVQVKTVLQKYQGGRAYPLECVHIKNEESSDLEHQEIAFIMLDYLDCYWSSYLTEERNVFVPIDWSVHECESISFYIRGFVRQPLLEEDADAFLRLHGHGEYDIRPISQDS